MKKSLVAFVALTVFSTAAAAAPLTAKEAGGKALYSADGKRVGAIYRVNADGSAVVILGGKLVTVPASTLSIEGGKVTTSLAKKEVTASR